MTSNAKKDKDGSEFAELQSYLIINHSDTRPSYPAGLAKWALLVLQAHDVKAAATQDNIAELVAVLRDERDMLVKACLDCASERPRTDDVQICSCSITRRIQVIGDVLSGTGHLYAKNTEAKLLLREIASFSHRLPQELKRRVNELTMEVGGK